MWVGVVVKKRTEGGLLSFRGLRGVTGGENIFSIMAVKLLCLLAASAPSVVSSCDCDLAYGIFA